MRSHSVPGMSFKSPLFWLAIVGGWTLFGLLLSAQLLTMDLADGTRMAAGTALRLGMASGLLWIPMVVVLLLWVRALPIGRARWWVSAGAALLLVVALAALRVAAVAVLNPWIGWYQEFPGFWPELVASFPKNFLLLCLMVGVAHAGLFAQRAHQREREAEQLKARLTETRLEALGAQLNPHFMFNALNSIAEMVHRDADAADRMLVGLGELLRSSLDHQRSQLVPLGEELRLLRHYLEIEKVRLGERLQLRWLVEPGLEDVLVPPLVLQPLAENAILHAIAPRTAAGLLQVVARREGAHLLLEVADDGDGIPGTRRHGTGLSNIRARLRYLFGDDQAVELRSGQGGGTTARVRLPCTREAVAA
ncbi:histidine kinase [Luteimonas sp. RD2P54]|uniref:histidine kinase n=1 Tax=Luteimonas endophytica TaxID=3042023 RepID=A0ABT6J963_9GAMM|nr:histidine kinase [Luteimonas endophytica]MDH5823362.1 histidine kinase [Luteimonas endophytica]